MSRTAGQSTKLLARRHLAGRCFEILCRISAWTGIVVLTVLLASVVWQSWGWLGYKFISSYASRNPYDAGILAAIWGSFWLVLLTGLISVPVGVGAALYLEEFSRDNWLRRTIQTNLANLAGVPSIVYGILGLTVFVRMFDLFGPPTRGAALKTAVFSLGFTELRIPLPPIPFGSTVIAGALTLSLLILPVVIVAAQEALRAVPSSIRHASLALGATRWQTIRHQVLPAATPGILTGVILSISRAIGETAPLLIIGAGAFLRSTPGGIESVSDLLRNPENVLQVPFDPFTALPIQIYIWVENGLEEEFFNLAAAAILVLLIILTVLNGTAIFIRHKYEKQARW